MKKTPDTMDLSLLKTSEFQWPSKPETRKGSPLMSKTKWETKPWNQLSES